MRTDHHASWRAWLRRLEPLVGVVLFVVALALLRRELGGHGLHEIRVALRSLPLDRVLAALVAVAGGYFALTLYDVLAVRFVGRRLPYSTIAPASFVSYAFAHNLGMAALTSIPLRVRFYSAAGLTAGEITRIVVFCSATFWFGFLGLGGLAMAIEGVVVPAGAHLGGTARPLGLLLLALALGWVVLVTLRRAPLRLGSFVLELPTPGMTLAQFAVSALDWSLAAAALWLLLPAEAHVAPAAFLAVYMLAQVVGLASQVPGGLGVFETAVVALLPVNVPAPTLLATLLAYRAIYYVVPLFVAAGVLTVYEVAQRRDALRPFAGAARIWVRAVVPVLSAGVVFIAGAVLLFSGATPGLTSRMARLGRLLPLPLLEASHFLGSVVGVALLFIARGLQRRLDAAYHMATLLLLAGAVFSVAKGLDVEEATILLVALALLVGSRKAFHRRGSLLAARFSPGWLASIAMVVSATIWLGFLAHRHVEYSSELWWQFALHGDASRFLRATVGVAVVALGFAVARLVGPVRFREAPPDDAALARAAPVVAASPNPEARLALVGDKRFLFDDDDRAFVMFAVAGRSWVGLGDPVGPADRRADLIWRFHELVDQHAGWTVFYEVGPESLPLYLDLGLTPAKLGEEAIVPLDGFTLDGPERKELRHARRRAEREGAGFEIVEPRGVPALLPELRRVSDRWLADKKAREKRFSLGSFDERYLAGQPMALVRREGRIVAFANVWLGGDGVELSVDLMRHTDDAPAGVMDYLFVELMLWGAERGARRFSLGMAPLSGLEDRSLAPLWTRLGAFLYRHGEEFYNFQGLRRYKEKFGPVWEPRYLVSPGGLTLPRVLANVASLIAGGVGGVFRK